MKNLKLKLKENYIYILAFIIPVILMGTLPDPAEWCDAGSGHRRSWSKPSSQDNPGWNRPMSG